MCDILHRYQTDSRFHSLVSVIERFLESVGDDFTTGEARDAFTVALPRRELLLVRPALGLPRGTVSDKLVDRLRGKYRVGPPSAGEPEFGYRQFDVPPIQIEAAAEIERLMRLCKEKDESIDVMSTHIPERCPCCVQYAKLRADNERLRAGYDRKPFESLPCPGCVYDNGVFVRRCYLHEIIDEQERELAAMDREAAMPTRAELAGEIVRRLYQPTDGDLEDVIAVLARHGIGR